MTWEEWGKEYPARKVEEKPTTTDPIHDNYYDAIKHKDWIEVTYEVGGLEIVEFEGLFYIVSRKD